MTKQDVIEHYREYCHRHHLPFIQHTSLLSYDDTTLFCPAGMQQYKQLYEQVDHRGTLTNSQSCLRLVDENSIGDSTHYLFFDMLGFFSFREWTVKQTVDFWLGFLSSLNLKPDYVTIHPDKPDWKDLYTDIEVRFDDECYWSDGGNLGGYCTEFYINDVEIGNIVNTGGHSIDVGFGCERITNTLNPLTIKTSTSVLETTIDRLLQDGILPSNKLHGYVLRKLMRKLWLLGGCCNHPSYQQEVERQDKIVKLYERYKDRNRDKSPEWWFETFGIDLTLLH